MATRKKTDATVEDKGMKLFEELVSEVYQIRKTQEGWYPIIDEMAGNSNNLTEISEKMTTLNETMIRIAEALENRNERSNT